MNNLGWKKKRWDRIDQINDYLNTLDDRQMILVAFLMMRGLSEKAIMKATNMSEELYIIARERLAFGLLFAGVAVRS